MKVGWDEVRCSWWVGMGWGNNGANSRDGDGSSCMIHTKHVFGRMMFMIRAAEPFFLAFRLMCACRSGDFLVRFLALTVSSKAILGGVSNVA